MTDLSTDFLDAPKPLVKGLGLAGIFTLTIFLSATLLFSVQPMFTKMILPLLGGSSNVWNTAMVFFQAMLLGGYIYAHLVTKYLPFKAQVATHLAVTAFGFIFLPLAVSSGIVVPESGMPTLWLLGLFAATVGAPFFALSANAPLLQRWFSLTDHKDAQDPYFLYAASNAGSLIILCLYPVLIEPQLVLGTQTGSWAVGYAALFVMIAVAGFYALRRLLPTMPAANVSHEEVADAKVSAKRMAFWVLLAFIPSSLMLGVTSYLTNNIASAPFLWIAPLALYLLTFVIVFAKNPIIKSAHMGWMFPWAVIVAFAFVKAPLPQIVQIIGSLVMFFVISLYCHSRLVEDRPSVSSLTTFYILMSVGGVLGGIFNALLAPVLFDAIYEYVIVLFVAAFILPCGKSFAKPDANAIKALIIGLIAAPIVGLIFVKIGWPTMFAVALAFLVFYMASLRLNLPGKFKVFLVITMVGAVLFENITNPLQIMRDRSFFSTLAVETSDHEFGRMHRFVHGNTVHNFQLRGEGLQAVPVSYYTEGGSMDSVVKAARAIQPNIAVSVIGLGAGAMACYEQAGDDWTYFEIDPKVVDMALTPELFSYMSKCAPDADIRIGDARQRMLNIPEGSQDLIVIDAFSSNAIPAHLMTREALAMYRSRLTENGIIFFHTSNRMMDVSSVAAVLAQDAGLEIRYIDVDDFEGSPYEEISLQAVGILVGSKANIEKATTGNPAFKAFEPSKRVKVWTDDYSSMIGAIRAKMLNDAKVIDIER